jgi:hypothetical protein
MVTSMEDSMPQLQQLLNQRHGPYSSFVPKTLKSNVLLMKATPLHLDIQCTVFLGTIRENTENQREYTERMWAEDVGKWRSYFGATEEWIEDVQKAELQNQEETLLELGAKAYYQIPMLPLENSPQLLNSSDAITKTEQALAKLNTLPQGGLIRVIHLGSGYASFLYDAVTYLLKEWRNPDGTARTGKGLQFITSGDTLRRDLSDFCQWLCISGVCDEVAYYNTEQYHPFGQCHMEYH